MEWTMCCIDLEHVKINSAHVKCTIMASADLLLEFNAPCIILDVMHREKAHQHNKKTHCNLLWKNSTRPLRRVAGTSPHTTLYKNANKKPSGRRKGKKGLLLRMRPVGSLPSFLILNFPLNTFHNMCFNQYAQFI
jgi:hypothetical protein